MISDSDLVKLLTDKTLGYIWQDEANPDIGMGMPVILAIKSAEKDVVREAARWNSIEALSLDQARFAKVRDQVCDAVRRNR